MSNPKFAHDCGQCTFLGNITLDDETFDLYHCGQIGGKHATIIVRFSNEGSEYASGLVTATKAYFGTLPDDMEYIPRYIEAMGIAYGRAKYRKLPLGK